MSTVKQVAYGEVVQLHKNGKWYKRINVSTRVVPRPENTTVLVNTLTGRMRFVPKNVEVIANT